MGGPTVLRYVSMLYRHSQMHVAKSLKGYGIGPGQHSFLLGICAEPGISQEGLSERLAIDKGTTAKAVKALIARGFVSRRRDPDDGRAYRLYPTDSGEALLELVREVLVDWQESLWAGLEPEERRLAFFLTERMAANARKRLEEDCRR